MSYRERFSSIFSIMVIYPYPQLEHDLELPRPLKLFISSSASHFSPYLITDFGYLSQIFVKHVDFTKVGHLEFIAGSDRYFKGFTKPNITGSSLLLLFIRWPNYRCNSMENLRNGQQNSSQFFQFCTNNQSNWVIALWI